MYACSQAKMKEHLVEVQNRREQHAYEIKTAIQNMDSQSRARELMIIDMLQQVCMYVCIYVTQAACIRDQDSHTEHGLAQPCEGAYDN